MSHEGSGGHAQPGRSGWPARVFEFFAEQWKSVLFSAAVALLLDHLGMLAVFTKVSWLVVGSLASQGPAGQVAVGPQTPTVVLIDSADFVERYGEKNPLDRCLLADDISRVLAKQPQRLAVDFDLSPLLRPNESEQTCQRRLDALLDREASRLVVLAPFPTSSPALQDAKHAWMQSRCAAGVHFGDGTLTQSLGMVTEQTLGEAPGLQARLAEQLAFGPSGHVCGQVVRARDAAHNPWLQTEGDGAEPAHDAGHEGGHEAAEAAPLNFPAAARELAVLSLRGERFDALPPLTGNPVLLGGDWGRDDSYLTSIGSLPGVALHGVRVVSLRAPVKAPSAWLGLLSDIGIALCFAWVVHRFWFGYVRARRFDLHHLHQATPAPRVALGALFMATFVIVYLSLAVFFVFAAQYVFVRHALVLAPLLIAMSILVDGFISGPVEQIQELIEEAAEPRHAPPDVLEPELWRLLNHVRLVYLVLLLLGGAWLLGWVDLAAVAGVSFLCAQALLYGLLALHVLTTAWRWLRGGPGYRQAVWGQAVRALRRDMAWLRQLWPHGPASLAAALWLTFGLWRPGRPPEAARVLDAARLLAVLRAVTFWIVLGLAARVLMH